MPKFILSFLFSLVFASVLRAENQNIYDLIPGTEYYIYNTYYKRPLGNHTDGKSPRLVAYNAAQESSYLWVVEASSQSGYVLLKQKSSGKYMVASTSNTYSVLLDATKRTENQYLWLVRPGMNGSLVNRKSTGKALGVDTGETGELIGVWYDKTQGVKTSEFAVFPSDGKGLESSMRSWAACDLSNVLAFLAGEVENLRNPLTYRNKLKKSMAEAEAMLDDASMTAEQLHTKALHMRDSLAAMVCSNESNVLLTESDMASFSSTFSLGMSGVTLDSENYPADSTYIIIRAKDGRGAKITIHEDGDYAFVKDGEKVEVYLNQQLQRTVKAVYLPKLTLQDTEAEWTILRKSRLSTCLPEILSENKAVTEPGKEDIDKYGNNTRTVISLSNVTLDLDHPVDFHLINESAPLTNCKINLSHEKAWLIFDNTLPSEVKANFLKYITINGKKAVDDSNCRIVIYLNGALVMPFEQKGILTGYSGEQYTGDAMAYGLGSITDMRKNANRIRSFRLKRGYMATLASDKGGKGYSRVFVADHKDLEIPVLPNALYGRISSINVRKWQYVSKKGWCSTTGNDAIAGETRKVRATWFYTWSADRNSTMDTEYIPIKAHIYWPGWNEINNRTNCTAVLGYNEPEHSEQHSDDCGNNISPWTACSKTPEFQDCGLRIGSPSPTDASWLTEYIQHCNDMSYRCDFVTFHAYWGPNEAANADAWKSRLQDIYNKTKRPIWITEWNYGASWTTEGWPSDYNEKLEKERAAIKSIQSMLESLPFVERYAIYNWDTYYRAMINWDDGSLLPAGKVYRDMKSDFAYNADVQFTPVWWAPSLKTPAAKVVINEADETLALTITNDNTDCTDQLIVQLRHDSGQWEDYYTETDRSLFDQNTLTYTFPLKDFNTETDQLRIYVKRTLGDEVYSASASFGYIVNPDINTSSMSDVEGWHCTRSAMNGYTKDASGDTYLEVWSANAAGMQFDYYQDITDLPQGIYELSAAVFNSSNGVEGATVNGNVVLYAQADSVMYVEQVLKDSEIDYDQRLVIPGIVVQNGKMRIGIRNIGQMTARWAGGDSFRLIRTGDLPANPLALYVETKLRNDKKLTDAFVTYTDDEQTEGDASAFIANPSCQRSDYYGWTVTGEGIDSGKSFDGQSSNAYWNLWKSSPQTATMQQEITHLPEGEYRLKAKVRGSTNMELTLTTEVLREGTVKQSETDVVTATNTIKGIGEVTDESITPYINGWMQHAAPFVAVRPGDTLRISFKAANPSGSGWWSVDDYGLDWHAIPTQLPDDLEETHTPTHDTHDIYDLMGRKIPHPTLRGIYIVNKKVIKL